MRSPSAKGLARTLIGSDMHCTQLAETSGDILPSSTGTLDTAFLKILHYTYVSLVPRVLWSLPVCVFLES